MRDTLTKKMLKYHTAQTTKNGCPYLAGKNIRLSIGAGTLVDREHRCNLKYRDV